MSKNCKKYFQKLGKYFSSGATSWESSHVASIAGTALSAGRYANGPAYYALFKPQMMAMMKMMKKKTIAIKINEYMAISLSFVSHSDPHQAKSKV